ncbi:hypothetical protein [Bradyrhizobium brasilense]|uniref:Uncharacterized protein n=1 Tax=Bradyrhizobium brasilense TaxID=1419277 RepID=A0ABY8JDR4_9BRAD|nr:hypothetical protein [Bradyrhizobium brasilense]WFU62756.1 hypothetical protein QA636_35815 [Bradyrhizobium brasilense]
MILETISLTMALKNESLSGPSALRVGDVLAVGLLKEQGHSFRLGQTITAFFD